MPTPNRPLRCGAVGVGRMGRHHARVYAQMAAANPEAIQMVGVVDANPDTAARIAEQHNTKRLRDRGRPPRRRRRRGLDRRPHHLPPQVRRPFLEAGVACLIEKPLAPSADEANKLKTLAEKTGACLMVGHIERFNPIMRAMQKATEKTGEPITPRFMEVHRVSPMTFRSIDIGVVMDMMIHDLDVVLMLMDSREPDDIQASGVAVVSEFEDLCNARLVWNIPDSKGGGQCVANITASRLALKTERVTRITGESGYIKIDYAAKTGTMIRRTANELQMREVREQLKAGKDLTDLNWAELVNIEPLQIDQGEPIVKEIEAFLDAVRTGSRPAIDATAGFVNVRTAERIVEAIRHSLGASAAPALG
jgi:predicted dehydrogenase